MPRKFNYHMARTLGVDELMTASDNLRSYAELLRAHPAQEDLIRSYGPEKVDEARQCLQQIGRYTEDRTEPYRRVRPVKKIGDENKREPIDRTVKMHLSQRGGKRSLSGPSTTNR